MDIFKEKLISLSSGFTEFNM